MTSTGRRAAIDPLAIGILVVCCALWGLGQVAVKVGLQSFPPLWQAGLRSLAATALVVAWSLWRGIALFRRDGTLGAGLLAGLLFAGEFACIYAGLQFTSASRLTVFLYLSPFVVALGMPFIAPGECLSRSQWAGLAVAFAGVALAFSEGWTRPSAGPLQWLGDLLGIAAAVLWGATTLAIRATRLATVAPEKTLAYQLAVSGLTLVALALLSGERWPDGLETLPMAALAYQVIVIAFATYLAWFWLIAHYPATRLASFTLLTPVAGLLFGVLLLDEALTPQLLLALAGVCLGIWRVNRR